MRQGISQDGPKLRHDGKLLEPKDKAKKCDYRSRTTTCRAPSRARSEKTAGAVIRTREVYRRRGEDLGDIGNKYNKK
jgi:hypothetical protein